MSHRHAQCSMSLAHVPAAFSALFCAPFDSSLLHVPLHIPATWPALSVPGRGGGGGGGGAWQRGQKPDHDQRHVPVYPGHKRPENLIVQNLQYLHVTVKFTLTIWRNSEPFVKWTRERNWIWFPELLWAKCSTIRLPLAPLDTRVPSLKTGVFTTQAAMNLLQYSTTIQSVWSKYLYSQ